MNPYPFHYKHFKTFLQRSVRTHTQRMSVENINFDIFYMSIRGRFNKVLTFGIFPHASGNRQISSMLSPLSFVRMLPRDLRRQWKMKNSWLTLRNIEHTYIHRAQ